MSLTFHAFVVGVEDVASVAGLACPGVGIEVHAGIGDLLADAC